MKNRFGLVTSLLTTLFAFGAFVALAMTLCSLTACAPAGDAAVSPPPPASPMEPSEQVSISLPDPSARPSEGAVPSLGVPASESVAPPPAQPSAAPSAPALAEVSQTPAQPSISPLNPSFPEIPLDDEQIRLVPAAEPVAQEPSGQADGLLAPAEYRLLQCLLYGRDTGWVQREGLLLSVLADGVNEKLYDQFLDCVLDGDARPVPDYIDDLKEMVRP